MQNLNDVCESNVLVLDVEDIIHLLLVSALYVFLGLKALHFSPSMIFFFCRRGRGSLLLSCSIAFMHGTAHVFLVSFNILSISN